MVKIQLEFWKKPHQCIGWNEMSACYHHLFFFFDEKVILVKIFVSIEKVCLLLNFYEDYFWSATTKFVLFRELKIFFGQRQRHSLRSRDIVLSCFFYQFLIFKLLDVWSLCKVFQEHLFEPIDKIRSKTRLKYIPDWVFRKEYPHETIKIYIRFWLSTAVQFFKSSFLKYNCKSILDIISHSWVEIACKY